MVSGEGHMPAQRTIVTSALPYANGDIHLGHLCSTYIPADVYTRFLRISGHEVVYVCGADEHGTPIEMSARERGMDPSDHASYFRQRQLNDLESMNIEFDNYHRTHSEQNRIMTENFLLKMRENGYIDSREVESYYCEIDDKYLPDRFVLGTCPYCGADDQYSDVCEKCQRALEPGEIKNPRCAICGQPPVTRSTRHFFFRLSDFSENLKQWLGNKPSQDFPSGVVNHILGWIKGGLKDWDITREDYWGFKLPYPDASEEQYAYVWVDAPICYFSSFIEWARRQDSSQEKWLEDPDTRLVHFIGKDIIQHHLIFWPAMLMAVGKYVLPSKYVVNGYISLEGRKMSKSRGWYIPVQRSVSRYPADYLRFYLSYKASNSMVDSNFSWEEFQDRVNKELADNIGNFVHRVFTFTYNNFGGKIPQPAELNERDREFDNHRRKMSERLREHYRSCKSSRVVQTLVEDFMVANRYFNDKKPWKAVKTSRSDAATTLYLCLEFLRTATAFLYPIIPETAEKIWFHLGQEVSISRCHPLSEGSTVSITPGNEIPEPVPLIEKIEDDKIEEESKWLEGEHEEEKQVKEDLIDIKDFKNLDIRIGKVLDVEEVEGSRNLLKLTVDMGEERTLVAGLAGHYGPDELIGRSITVLTNLKPAKIFGVESQGMLLAAVDGDRVSVLVPDKDVSPGTGIE